MILRSLQLQNLRSYTNQTVLFPMGTTLFEGDIGSGKSTVLMAIEFALFGLGSEKGAALLKVGTKRGLVKLCFEVEEKEYEVCRSLERKVKGIQQTECTLKTDGTLLQLTPSEMKERILEILNFNEPPDPKAQSVIYRYAIFTPQEEMKTIITMRADLRLQTLRKAFRIEDYRTAIDNASILARTIREKSNLLAELGKDVESVRDKRKEKTLEIGKCEEELVSLIDEKTCLGEKATSLKAEVDALQIRKDLLRKAAGEVPLLERRIKEKNAETVSLESEIAELSVEIERLQVETAKLGNAQPPTPKTEDEIKSELRILREKERELRSKQTTIKAKIGDYESVERDKICPTCDREADPKEFEEKIRQKTKEKQEISQEVNLCETRIKEMEDLQESLRECNKNQTTIQNLAEQRVKSVERLVRHRERIQTLNVQIQETRETLEKARQDIEQYNKIQTEMDKVSKELKKIELQFKETEKTIFKIQAKRDELAHRVSELEKEIEEKENQNKKAERLREYEIWFEGYFMPTLEKIERQVMLSISQDFNQHFQRWWTMLVEDLSKESRIDENFTPLVEQDGYEQDANYLSGGEKTSLALAYRLSLNTIAQKVSTGIKSNLLILDEPTDGFSKEQLFKIREILDQLQCPQVIMVSHERELESFADHVISIEKKDGESQIRAN